MRQDSGLPEKRPLSDVERRLFLLEQLQSPRSTYAMIAALRLEGNVDVQVLRAVLADLPRLHPNLGTSFKSVFQVPIAEYDPSSKPRFSYKEIECGSFNQNSDSLRDEIRSDLIADLSLQSGHVAQAILYKLDSELFVLGLAVHHICADGWSIVILIEDIVRAYNLLVRCEDLDAAARRGACGYQDFIRDERSRIRKHGDDAQLFWQQYLEEVPPTLDIITDKFVGGELSNSAIQTYDYSVSEGTTSVLSNFCRERNLTRFTVLLAVFVLFVSRRANTQDVLIAVPVANRSSSKFSRTVGCFVNTVPFRIQVNHNEPFVVFLKRVDERWREVRKWQWFPFGSIVEAVKPARVKGRPPVMQVSFSYMDIPFHPPEMEEVDLKTLSGNRISLNGLELPSGESKFDLSLTIEAVSGSMQARLEFAEGLADLDEAAKWEDHLNLLLELGLMEPDKLVGELDSTELTQDSICADGIAIDRDTAVEHSTLVDQVLLNVRQFPDRLALEAEGTNWTYKEFMDQGLRIASCLEQHGVRRGDRIALIVGRTGFYQAAILGVWYLGASFVPFDAEEPLDHISKMIDEADVSLVLFEDTICSLTELECESVAASNCKEYPPLDREPNSFLEDEAYVIFTSGSTGQPKGVIIQQSQLAALQRGLDARFDFGGSVHRLAQIAGPTFDVCIEDFIRTFCFANTMIVFQRMLLLDMKALCAELIFQKITFIELVPSVLRVLLQHSRNNAICFPDLKTLVSGAEPISLSEMSDALAVCNANTKIYNSYGVTETTIDNFVYELDHKRPSDSFAPIGKPLNHTYAFILDEERRLVPSGCVGELYLAGPCVGKGYLGNVFLDRFCDMIVENGQKLRVYRTGDMARATTSGDFQCLGRLDHQIKKNGVRVNLEVIEETLRGHPLVRDASARFFKQDSGHRLIAYVCGVFDVDAPKLLAGWIRRKLPSVSCPDQILVLDDLPRTVSNKIDRLKLPLPGPQQFENSAPLDAAEQTLASIWSKLLGEQNFTPDDDFFAVGGHSLLLGQLAIEIRSTFETDLPIRRLFEHTRLREQAQLLKNERSEYRVLKRQERNFSALKTDENGRVIDHDSQSGD